MGLIVEARCGSCGFARTDLRVGATTAQMSGERRSALHLFGCRSCREVASVELFLGEPRPSAVCACGQARELRIVTLTGERLAGHPCPACASATLSFKETGKFL